MMKRLINLMFTAPVLLAALGSTDTARAQDVTLSVAPPATGSFPLVFNNIPANSVSAAQTVTVTASKTTTVVVQVSDSWIVPSNVIFNVGTSGSPLGIKVNTQNLAQGSYSGTVTITVNGQSSVQQSFGVNLNVNGTSVLSANPSSLSFVAEQGGTSGSPASTVVKITSSGPIFNYTISAQTSGSSGNWLLLSSTTGTTGDAGFTVSVNPSGLAVGSYQGTITVTALNDSNNDAVQISVSLTVNASASLSVNPTNPPPFLWQTGTANPQPLNLSLTASGGSVAFNVQVNPPASWLIVTPQNGTTNAAITLSPNPLGAGLPAGTYQTNVNISAGTDQVSVPVTLIVATHPLLQLSTNSLGFSGQYGSTQSPPDQTVQVSTASDSSGGQAFHFASDAGWLTASTTGTNFSTGADSTTPATLTVRVNPTGLQVGSYTGHISITPSNGDSYTQTITVTFSITAAATLLAGPQNLLFSYQLGQSPPGAQLVSVQSSGQPITFTITPATAAAPNCPANWLSAASSNNNTTPATLTVSAAVASMTAGSCSGTISLGYTSGGSQATLIIGVSVAVSASDKPELTISFPAGFGVEKQVLNAGSYSKTITLGTTDSGFPDYTAVVSQASGGGTWLGLAGQTQGNAPANLVVTFNPSALPTPGTYTGNIQISSTTLPFTMQGGTLAVPITMTITSNVSVSVSPASLTFNEAQGGPTPPAQTLTLSSTGGTANYTVGQIQYNQASGWLQVTPSSGATSGTIQVSVAANTLSQGTYTATIPLGLIGATSTSLNIPVTLKVGPSQTVTVSANSLSFAYQITGPQPAPQTITVSSTGGSAQFAVGVTSSGWLSVNATSGATPKDLNVSVVTAGLQPGTYNGSISISSPGVLAAPLTVSVTLTVTAAPVPQPAIVRNAASYVAGVIAPGELISIFAAPGGIIGPSTPASFSINASGGVDPILAGVRVLFGGVPGTPTYVSASQINAIVPYEIAGQLSTNLVVEFNGVQSAPIPLGVRDNAPGLFTANSQGIGQVSAINQDGTINGAPGSGFAPARPGTIISVYGTGGGQTSPLSATGSVTPLPRSSSGPFFNLQGPVTATIGGQPATVTFAGAAPGLVNGVFQINILIPATASGDKLALTVSINGVQTPPVGTTIAVQ